MTKFIKGGNIMYINVYKLKEMPKEDYERIMKRSETETDSILEDVEKIIDKVKKDGDSALVEYTKKFENVTIYKDKIQVAPEEIKEAYTKVDKETIEAIKFLADNVKNRLGVFSLYIDDIHFNLVAKILNDRFGIQTRGGCACAGTYGHYLLDVSYDKSKRITELINSGDLSEKPGWIRISLHPTTTDQELFTIIDALHQIRKNYKEWEKDYIYNKHTNEFRHKDEPEDKTGLIKNWFDLDFI